MALRSVGNATVSFGLVSIPVKLYNATSATSAISFNLLHKDCGSRLKQQYLCAKDGVPVERDQMVKGYEFAKDQYVLFTPEELKALEERPTQTIDIAEFVPLAQVDPVYFDKAYYLSPERGGEKAYRLLVEAMEATGRAALARYPARGKQYLVLIRPRNEALVMQQLLYAEEVRPITELAIPRNEIKEAELKLAVQLVEQIASDTFHPEQYRDEVKERIEAEIRKKVEGQEIAAVPEGTGPAQIIDLMEALKASLAKGTGRPASVDEGAAEAPPHKQPRRAVGPAATETPAARGAKK